MERREIERELQHIHSFKGCFSILELPPIKSKMSLVVNLQSDGKYKYGHWVGLIFPSKKKCFYFDSFGEPPPSEILEYLQRTFSKLIFNPFPIQSILSEKCGYFTIAFIKEVSNRSEYDKFLSRFEFKHLMKNDKIVKRLLE